MEKHSLSWGLRARRELVFLLHLGTIFTICFSTMQMGKMWLSQKGWLPPIATTKFSTRTFWPRNMLSLLPAPDLSRGKQANAPSVQASSRTGPLSRRLKPEVAQVTRMSRYNANQRLQQPSRQSYRWAQSDTRLSAGSARRRPAQTKQSPAQNISPKRLTPVTRPIQRILRENYQIQHPEHSYNSYMEWVRVTLKDYKQTE